MDIFDARRIISCANSGTGWSLMISVFMKNFNQTMQYFCPFDIIYKGY